MQGTTQLVVGCYNQTARLRLFSLSRLWKTYARQLPRLWPILCRCSVVLDGDVDVDGDFDRWLWLPNSQRTWTRSDPFLKMHVRRSMYDRYGQVWLGQGEICWPGLGGLREKRRWIWMSRWVVSRVVRSWRQQVVGGNFRVVGLTRYPYVCT